MNYDVDKMYCGQIKRGDVFVCEHEDKKKTLVVLQDDVLNGSMPTVICALVDFDHDGREYFANEVVLDQSDLGNGASGVCMLHKLVTIDRRLVREKKKQLSHEKMKQIYAALDVNLGRFRDYEYPEHSGLVDS